GNTGEFREGFDLRAGAGHHRAAAAPDHGLFRRAHGFQNVGHIFAARPHAQRGKAPKGRVASKITLFVFGAAEKNIEREVEHDRARTTRGGHAESAFDQLRNPLRLVDLDHGLGHGLEQRRLIEFLEVAAQANLVGGSGGDGDDRNGIRVCRCKAGDEIGDARSRRRIAHTDTAGNPRIAVRHMGSALLVPDKNVADPAIAIERIVEAETIPRNAEDVGNSETFENAYKGVRALQLHIWMFPSGDKYPSALLHHGRRLWPGRIGFPMDWVKCFIVHSVMWKRHELNSPFRRLTPYTCLHSLR